MAGFDPKHPRGVYPGARSLAKQFVLITEKGEERTSNVTTERIYKAVFEIEANEYVTLEKCVPVAIGERAEAFAFTYYKGERLAVFFRVDRSILRMIHTGFSCQTVADMMCDCFESSKLPDMDGWQCEELKYERPRKDESSLSVDGFDYRHFDYTDVMAALDNIRDGKSNSLHHSFSGEDGGYIDICRSKDDSRPDALDVEWVKWTKPDPTGYRTVTNDFESLRTWLWDFTMSHKYPAPAPEWQEFDVTAYFEQLILKYSDNKDER